MSRRLAVPHRVCPNFLTAVQHTALLDWALANRARFEPAGLKLAGSGRGLIDPKLRQSLSLRDLGAMGPVMRDRIEALVPTLIRDLRLTPFTVGELELELVAHNDGAHFTFHADTFIGADRGARGDRMLSCIYYFHREPKGFSGGELRLHRFGESADDHGFATIEPCQNSLIVFPSWAPHEVSAVSCASRDFADSRFAVNCWVYRARLE